MAKDTGRNRNIVALSRLVIDKSTILRVMHVDTVVVIERVAPKLEVGRHIVLVFAQNLLLYGFAAH